MDSRVRYRRFESSRRIPRGTIETVISKLKLSLKKATGQSRQICEQNLSKFAARGESRLLVVLAHVERVSRQVWKSQSQLIQVDLSHVGFV
jgi:hypothetical protein